MFIPYSKIAISVFGLENVCGGLNLLEENKDGEVRFIHSGNLLKNYPQNKYTKVRIIKEVDKALLVGTTEGLLSMH